jgi:hypothetical protein
MDKFLKSFLVVIGILLISLIAGPASANTATVRCVTRQSQISVYESVTTLRVEGKLKCGEDVEIIERVKDYVKIRAQNGVEGYVPDTLFAGFALPAPGETSASATGERVGGQPAIAESTSLPVADAPGSGPVNPPLVSATPARDSDDVPEAQPENESANPACQNYFSAYGLSPNQMKWIAQNRKKLFSNVCPAPNISKVDFVIIFTHDVDFFGATMPKPVHMVGGFSDFTAMTPFDTELMSASEADKAHRQYVWIFHFEPGTFDPAGFSPRRRCQYWKVESNALGSKAGLKTVEDAFQFVAAASH